MNDSAQLRPGRILLGCMFLLATRVPAREPMRPGTPHTRAGDDGRRLSVHVHAGKSSTRTRASRASSTIGCVRLQPSSMTPDLVLKPLALTFGPRWPR